MELEFNKFVYLGDIPLWSIAGPEMNVYTRDTQSEQFFSELAGIRAPNGERVAIRMTAHSVGSATGRDSNAADAQKSFDSIIVYAVHEESAATRIAARPLLVFPRLAPNPPAAENPRPADNVVLATAPELAAPSEAMMSGLAVPGPAALSTSSAARQGQGIPDVKKAIQQTVLGALRLRGIQRDDPDFKNIYHIVLRATELALRRRSKADIAVTDIHEKVEALLAIVE